MRAFINTSFLIRLLNENDPLNSNAKRYLRILLDSGCEVLLSTIAIAEYCVRGNIDDLPLAMMHILPFDEAHAVRAGEYARSAFDSNVVVSERRIIPNDCKLFAQADCESSRWYLTSDGRSRNLFEHLQNAIGLSPEFIDIRESVDLQFGGATTSQS